MASNIKPICDVVVFREGRVAMIDYIRGPDEQVGWYLPNDILNDLEHPDDAAQRIVKDNLGQDCIELGLVDIDSFSGRDGSWHLAFHYACKVKDDVSALPEGISSLKWFDPEQLPARETVAHHGWYLSVLQSVLTKYAA